MQIRRKTGLFALFLISAFFLYACGGGGGGSSTPPAPTATTAAATAISLHTATLNGIVNPNAQATNAFFEWGTDNALVNPTLTPDQAIGAGSADNSVSAPITGLALGTTYYYRVAATNAAGTNKGAIASFTTALPNSPPSVTTNAATSVTLSGAVLNGTVNPNELATTAVFEWGTDPTLAIPTLTSSQPLGAGTTSVAITAPLTGLTPGTTYFFRVAATNSAGTTKGLIATFTPTAQAPTVATGAPTSVTPNGLTLNGTVNPNGLAVSDAHFEYGTDSSLATFTSTGAQPLAAGFTGQAITASLTGLTPGTTYFFRVAATNSVGTTKGLIVSQITVAQAPTVATAAGTSVTPNGLTLNGTVNPNGLAVSDAHFEYGTDNTLATFTSTIAQSLAAGFTVQPITASLTGLTPVTTYYFRVAATNSVGTSKGLIISQITGAQAPTVATGAADNLSATGATLHGTVNPNGLAVSDAHFEYGTDSNLATFTSTVAQPLAAGFTGQAITASLTGLTPGTTYYFRVAATNSEGTSKGLNVSFITPQNPPPVAVAHFNETVWIAGPNGVPTGFLGATVVTLDGSESFDDFGTITTYEWTQIGGTNIVTIADNAAATTTFKAPALPFGTSDNLVFQLKVTDNRGLSGTDNITKNVKWGFLDDFSTDSTGTYTKFQTLGAAATLTHSSVDNTATVLTGGTEGIIFSKEFKILPEDVQLYTNTGVFSLDFNPVAQFGSGGYISIRLLDSPNTYYELSTLDNVVKKVREVAGVGVVVDSAPFPFPYSQGGTYPIKITFSPEITTFEAFGESVALTGNTSSNAVNYFEVETNQQNAKYDNILLEAAP